MAAVYLVYLKLLLLFVCQIKTLIMTFYVEHTQALSLCLCLTHLHRSALGEGRQQSDAQSRHWSDWSEPLVCPSGESSWNSENWNKSTVNHRKLIKLKACQQQSHKTEHLIRITSINADQFPNVTIAFSGFQTLRHPNNMILLYRLTENSRGKLGSATWICWHVSTPWMTCRASTTCYLQ